MVTGGEKTRSLIVMGPNKHRWVGFGWIEEGPARYPQDKKLPHAV
jgi:hypothetical protein